jgi:hypothetical protein
MTVLIPCFGSFLRKSPETGNSVPIQPTVDFAAQVAPFGLVGKQRMIGFGRLEDANRWVQWSYGSRRGNRRFTRRPNLEVPDSPETGNDGFNRSSTHPVTFLQHD